MSSPASSYSLGVVSTGNEELDNRLGGGLPFPSLIILEGDNGTGKTALCDQFTYGLTSVGKKVLFITTENSVKNFLQQAKNISYDLVTPYVKGLLSIIPAHLGGIRWDSESVTELFELLTDFIRVRSEGFDAIIFDSLSLLTNYLPTTSIHNFMTELRQLVKYGKLAVITIHPKMIGEEAMRVVAATSDVYFRLYLAEIGGRGVKVINVVKIRGAPTLAESTIAFDVDPAFGVKIVPLALAKV
ncbi:MAG: flagellar accessory protein FlaH [Sulfolobales archaeon]|nr:flagellar accessory protein FlaH [Sulfolobales archaeon]